MTHNMPPLFCLIILVLSSICLGKFLSYKILGVHSKVSYGLERDYELISIHNILIDTRLYRYSEQYHINLKKYRCMRFPYK